MAMALIWSTLGVRWWGDGRSSKLMMAIAFPDSVAEVIEYNVPSTPFPKEIDELCGFVEQCTPIMRLNHERIDP